MTTLADLNLTPNQQAELNNQEPELVNAWLNALTAAQGIKSPIGWFLAGIRTGQPPHTTNDLGQRIATQKAEALIRNIGPNILTEHELYATIFGPVEMTADLDTLEWAHAQLNQASEAVLGPALRAQIANTRTNGRQPVPDTGGPMRNHDTPAARERMLNLWRLQQARHTAPAPPTAAPPETWATTDDRPPPDEATHHEPGDEPTIDQIHAQGVRP